MSFTADISRAAAQPMNKERVNMSLTDAERNAISADDFADPANKKYPCDTLEHLRAAIHLYGRADNPDAVKAAIIRIAKRKGWEAELPEDWLDNGADDMNERLRARIAQKRG